MFYLFYILPILKFLELLGLQQVTCVKNTFNCAYNKVMSFPLKIFATKVPPGLKTCVVIFNAYFIVVINKNFKY